MSVYLRKAASNEACARYLQLDGSYPDWEITVLFYAAMHFVYARLFPLEVNKQKFESFHDMINATRRSTSVNQHEETVTLVYQHLNSIGPAYQKLLRESKNCRYRTDAIQTRTLEDVRKNFAAIKAFCISAS